MAPAWLLARATCSVFDILIMSLVTFYPGDATSISAGAKQLPRSADGGFRDDTSSAPAPPLRANVSLLNKLEASRMHALESLSRWTSAQPTLDSG